LDRTKL